MNEKLRELMVQADYPAPELALRAQRLAELIVRECILELGISKKCDPYTGELFVCEHNAVLDEQIDMLKEHFGVEE